MDSNRWCTNGTSSRNGEDQRGAIGGTEGGVEEMNDPTSSGGRGEDVRMENLGKVTGRGVRLSWGKERVRRDRYGGPQCRVCATLLVS